MAPVTTTIGQIRKRNGTLVDFYPGKITTAMEKAMLAVLGRVDNDNLKELTLKAVKRIEERWAGGGLPDVEGVQDVVERTMMEDGFYDVARAYILYRERHREMREERQQQVLQKIRERQLAVVKRSGEKQVFDENKIRRYFLQALNGYEGVIDVDLFLDHCLPSIHEGTTTSEIAQLCIMTARSFIERDPSYSVITTNLFRFALYKEAIGKKYASLDLEKVYRETFIENIKQAVALGRLTPELLNFDLERLAAALQISRDKLLPFRGLQALYDRCYISDQRNNRRLETPQAFWMRIAMGLALGEKEKEKWAIEFYEVLSTLRFMNSTPTLFHAATTKPQLSSCYLTTVEDDLHHIFKCIGDNSQMAKWAGGVANDWSGLRATGALIKTTNVESQGVIPFLKIANDTTVAINRSGRRRGATCAYLETWHFDIEDFLDLRRNTGDERRRTHDMNIANWIPDLFMKRVTEDGDWTLFSPDEVPDLHHIYGRQFEVRYQEYEAMADRGEIRLYKRLRARDLWKKMLTRLFETGHPWMTWKDPVNIRSPQDHAGVIHSSNLCTEITLNTSKDETAVCNLGSVNLARHVINGRLDEGLIRDTVTVAMRMLDNVIDINYYPTPEGQYANLRHRPVGLGVMGFQDVLYLLDINFDSEEAVQLADESMEMIAYYAILTSANLAKERGSYETYQGSKWQRGIFPQDTLDLLEEERMLPIEVPRAGKLDWLPVREAVRQYGIRNSNCLAIAPTATISNICGCFPSIEPIYKNLYVKSNISGEFTVDNQYLINDLKAIGLWNDTILERIKANDGSIRNIAVIPQRLRDKYKEAFEIAPEWLIRAAAQRGKWIDQSQSLNIFTNTNSGKVLSDIYLYAWRLGLKTTYYLRTLGATAIEKSTVDLKSQQMTTVPANPDLVLAESVMPAAVVAIHVNEDGICEACQ